MNIIHRDIKPENLVLDERGYVRITDFGIAKVFSKNIHLETSGTPGYMAPEVMNKQNHTAAVDFFALGVIGYEFMIGKRPYVGGSRKEIKDLMMMKQAKIMLRDIPDGWSEEGADFINRLIQRKPENRLGYRGVNEVKEHPWIKDFPWRNLLEKNIDPPFKPSKKDNFDKKYCDSYDKISLDTRIRYEKYRNSLEYSSLFKNFTFYAVIEDNFKEVKKTKCRNQNFKKNLSLGNKMHISKIDMNSNSMNSTLSINNPLTKRLMLSGRNASSSLSYRSTKNSNIPKSSSTLNFFCAFPQKRKISSAKSFIQRQKKMNQSYVSRALIDHSKLFDHIPKTNINNKLKILSEASQEMRKMIYHKMCAKRTSTPIPLRKGGISPINLSLFQSSFMLKRKENGCLNKKQSISNKVNKKNLNDKRNRSSVANSCIIKVDRDISSKKDKKESIKVKQRLQRNYVNVNRNYILKKGVKREKVQKTYKIEEMDKDNLNLKVVVINNGIINVHEHYNQKEDNVKKKEKKTNQKIKQNRSCSLSILFHRYKIG